MNALKQIAARGARKKIVLPEGGDERVVMAGGEAAVMGLADVVLVGGRDTVAMAKAIATAVPGAVVDGLRVIDPNKIDNAERYAEVLLRAKKHKGITRDDALKQVRDPLTLAMCMTACGDADGCVAGAAHTTADVMRAALTIVGAKQNLVSSFFVMQHDRPHQALAGAAVFADCALVVEPDAAQLARIAIDSADSAAALLKIKPRVALLSFSTAGSARHPSVDKVVEAGGIVAEQRPDIDLLAEVQFDAAVAPEILKRKAPHIKNNAPANIFIFPDLQSANIGYKIAERIGGVSAVGPILQGLKRPVNDLSRGCNVDDIVSLIAVTAVQAQ